MFMDLSQAPGVAPLHQALPWLIAANALLFLSSAELARLLVEEVAQNLALELDERLHLSPAVDRPSTTY